MAKEISGFVKLQVKGGQANPQKFLQLELFVWELRQKRDVITKKHLQWQKKSQDLLSYR
jgi:hypothetical protein